MDYYEDFKAKMLSNVLPKLPRYCQWCGGRRGTVIDYNESTTEVSVKVKCSDCWVVFIERTVTDPEELLDDKYEYLR